MSLCFRCENRALFLEKGFRPRFECGEPDRSKYACYCFQPVKPIGLARDREDKRPQFGPWMITSRSHRTKKDPEVIAKIAKVKGGFMPYWVPDEKAPTKDPE
jgi:hypothetical protein